MTRASFGRGRPSSRRRGHCSCARGMRARRWRRSRRWRASRSAPCTTTTPTRTRSSSRSSWRSSPTLRRSLAACDEEFTVRVTAANLQPTLDDLGRRLALAIMRPEVVALRRLLIGEAREFPALASEILRSGARSGARSPGVGIRRTWDGSGCCAWPTRASPPRSSRISWWVSRSTARCSSGRSRPGSTSSPARGKASRRSWLDIGLRAAAACERDEAPNC